MNGVFTSHPQNTLPPGNSVPNAVAFGANFAVNFNFANACVVRLSGDEEEA